MIEHKDFLGNKIEVGDEVVFMQIHYRSLLRGTIIRLTKQKAVIQHERQNIGGTESIQFKNQLVKI